MAGAQANIRNFITPLKGPGRTAAALLQDLILYDPTKRSQQNILEDGIQALISVPKIGDLLSPDSCRHEFILQKRQSLPPILDQRPTERSVNQVAAVCRKCRLHLRVKTDYTVAWQDSPCPNQEHPLHHLCKSQWRQDAAYRDLQRDDPGSGDEVFVFECSSSTCSAIVTVRITLPILTDDLVHTLIDRDLLSSRTEAAFELKKGHTEGMGRPSPLDVLSDLRAYLHNVWKDKDKSEINLANRRFVVRFGPGGDACKDVLEQLRFTLKPGESWSIPLPDTTERQPFQQATNVFLDDAEAELDCLIVNQPQAERQGAQDLTKLEPASAQLARVLSAQNYERYRANTALVDPSLRTRPYTILGIPEDVSDDIVIFAYQRQMATGDDELRANAILMTALEEVQKERRSELLSNQVAIERSIGRHNLVDVNQAYKSLGLDSNSEISDDLIIGTYNAQRQDVSAAQKQQLKENLALIGEDRHSRRLAELARDEILTYNDALSFLDAGHSTDDSFITTMYTTKVVDDASNVDMARKAVRLIAEHRNSENLKAFIHAGYEGQIQSSTMDLGEAFKELGIGDRTLNDELIHMVYTSGCEDAPGNREKLTKAVTAIAMEDDRFALRAMLGIESTNQVSNATTSEPTGLKNIGNTCYLNSLLQWFFTILPVREIVLNYDDYKADISDIALATRRVGQRKLTQQEVKIAQSFAVELAQLFQQMVTSHQKVIEPSAQLARLTLETSAGIKRRRESTVLSPRRGTLGEIDSQPIMGPLPRSAYISPMDEDTPLLNSALEVVQSPEEEKPTLMDDVKFEGNAENNDQGSKLADDNNSDITLVSRPGSEDLIDLSNIGKELPVKPHSEPLPSNEPVQSIKPPQTSSTTHPEPLQKAADLDAAAQNQGQENPSVIESTVQTVQAGPEQSPMIYAPPPGKPPPIPPRPTKPVATTQENAPRALLEEYARQQDVTEVMQHTVIQLSSAIRPQGVGPNQEQQDEVHDTFYGEYRQHIMTHTASQQEPTPFLNLHAPLKNEPTDVYGALDNDFDLQEREDGGKVYQSITKLPPVLTINLGRVDWDKDAQAQKKIDCHVEMPETIYMDRYMEDSGSGTLFQRRQASWQYKKELGTLLTRKRELEKHPAGPADEILEQAIHVINYLKEVENEEGIESLEFPDSALQQMNTLAAAVKLEREQIKEKVAQLQQNIRESFTDMRNHAYTLHAAFFHRGAAGSGHYWVYIHDHKDDIWRKYNDENVTHVKDLNEIFGDPKKPSNPNYVRIGTTATPYFLVYVRTDRLESIVETVKREVIIPENQTSQQQETISGLSDLKYAGQPSQMSYMPPDSMRDDVSSQGAQAGSLAGDDDDEMDEETQTAVAMSLQKPVEKEGDWDDSSAQQRSGW